MSVDVRSSLTILNEMVSKILAETNLTDISPGSEVSKILEAAANSDFQNSVAVLNILQSIDLDSLVGTDLDKKAEDLNLPNGVGGIGRLPSRKSSGTVSINSAFNKLSTLIYQGKPAPFIGSTTVYIQDATNWPSSGGQLYLGRGTDHEEGPLTYTAINNTQIRPFYIVTLSTTTPVTKNHVIGETVILAQGGVRTISSGSIVIAPSVNSVPAVQFTTDTNLTLLDGESTGSVSATCSQFGTTGNVQSNAIIQFSSIPFTGATITNPSSFASGQDSEDDNSLRQRIKDYAATLSRGTVRAIQSYLRGLSDLSSGRTITSVNVIQPTVLGNASRAYIDDGQGLEPKYQGIPFESLLSFSTGNENLFRTSKSPVIPPVAKGSVSEPFTLVDGQTLVITLDDNVETFTVNAKNYINVSAALATEIVNDFNTQNSRIRFRAVNNQSQVNAFDLEGNSETMTVSLGTVQTVLGLPLYTIRPLFLYKNNTLLSQKGYTASLTTNNFPWVGLTSGILISNQVAVDGVIQSFSVTDADFNPATIQTANISQWATVLSRKIAGVSITPVIKSDGTSYLLMQTRYATNPLGSLQVVSTSWVGDGLMWNSSTTIPKTGKSSDYSFNRFSGQISLASAPSYGDAITVATKLTRALTYSKTTANSVYSLGVTNIGNPRIIVGVDGTFNIRDLSSIPSGSSFTPSDPYSNSTIVRLLANNVNVIPNIMVNDFIYLANDTNAVNQIPSQAVWKYKVRRKGFNTTTVPVVVAGCSFTLASGSNIATVTAPSNHGLVTGMSITISAVSMANSSIVPGGTAAISGVKNVTVTSPTTFTFLMSVTATGNSTPPNTFTFTLAADSWIEIEASSANSGTSNKALLLAIPSISVNQYSLFAFQCDNAIPQIIDFGTSAQLTTDAVISAINATLSSGVAVKESPRRLFIRTNKFDLSGSVAILATISSAINIFATSTSNNIQTHTGNVLSSTVWSGSPKILGAIYPIDSYYQTRNYLQVKRDYLKITDSLSNPTIAEDSSVATYPLGMNEAFITGLNSGIMSRVYNNTTTAPYAGFARGLNTYKPESQPSSLAYPLMYDNETIRMEEIPFGINDKLVVIADNDTVNKSSSVYLAKNAKILEMVQNPAGASGSQMIFTLADSDDTPPSFPQGRPFFDNSSVFNTFDLTDFNVLFRPLIVNYIYPNFNSSLTTLPVGNPAAAIIIRSTQWGDSQRVKFSANYANTANSVGVIISHTNVVQSGSVLEVSVKLPTGSLVNGSTFTSATYTITPSDYPWTAPSTSPAIVQLVIASSGINPSNVYQVGNYLNIGGTIPTAYAGTYLIIATTANSVTVAAPGIRVASYSPTTLDASIYPVSSFFSKPATIGDIVTAINNYSVDNPVITAQFTTSDPMNFSLASFYYYPTFFTQGNLVANNNLPDIATSIEYHSAPSPFGCVAAIHTNNSPTGYIALVQYPESVLPTTAQVANVGYFYTGEAVKIIPASMKSISNWINLKAITPLSSNAEIARCGLDNALQISTSTLGGSGSIQVAGVKANSLVTPLLANPTNIAPYVNCSVAFSDAESLVRGSLVKASNALTTSIQRAYRAIPTGTSITAANTINIQDYFRPTTVINYTNPGLGIGRFTFVNSASGLAIGSNIVITKIDTFVTKLTCSTGVFSARVGDMLYISQSSAANAANKCYAITADTTNQYVGYPVVSVASATEIYVLGANIIADTFSIGSASDLLFIPMMKNEKNIATNYKSSAAFKSKVTGATSLFVRLKSLGNGIMFCSTNTETTSDMQLSGLSVSTDDFVVFSTGFKLSNQGKYRLIAHDGASCFIFFNPNGVDELVNSGLSSFSVDSIDSYGSVVWGSQLTDSSVPTLTDKRQIRMYDADSIFEGDYLSVLSPATGTISWFTSDLIGKWKILEIGIDSSLNSYVQVSIPNANVLSQSVTLGANTNAVGFVEQTPFYGFRSVVGSGINPQISTYSDLAVSPASSFYKLSPSNGTTLSCLFKAGFNKNINSGVDGYQTYSELLALAATVIDGSPTDSVSYPGVKAAGTAVDIQAPLERTISMSVNLQSTPGVGLNSIKDPVKSAISNYVKALGVGDSVILSEIIKRVQQIPGVLSVVIESTIPAAINGVISVSPIEVARIARDSDISI